MEFVIPFLILLFLYPFLSIPFLLAFAVFLAVFFFIYVVFGSFVLAVEAPIQLVRILFDKETRKNHSLEHATANVLEEMFGPLSISGYATKKGFFLMGELPSHHVILGAAKEGLERMKRGERELAIHPRCGTSILAANLLFSVVIVGGIVAFGYFSFINFIAALVVSYILGRPFGRLMQRYVTTYPDVSDMEILGILVEPRRVEFMGFVVLGFGNRVFVRTRRVKTGSKFDRQLTF